jgi:hypothetical protein
MPVGRRNRKEVSMKPVRVVTTVLPAMLAVSNAALAMAPATTGPAATNPAATSPIATSPIATSPIATSPGRSGKIYTDALNLLEARGYRGMNLISHNGTIVHATATTRSGKRVSVRVDTATGILLPG